MTSLVFVVITVGNILGVRFDLWIVRAKTNIILGFIKNSWVTYSTLSTSSFLSIISKLKFIVLERIIEIAFSEAVCCFKFFTEAIMIFGKSNLASVTLLSLNIEGKTVWIMISLCLNALSSINSSFHWICIINKVISIITRVTCWKRISKFAAVINILTFNNHFMKSVFYWLESRLALGTKRIRLLIVEGWQISVLRMLHI